MKNQSGVSVISMTIVVVLIIILASFSILTSRDVVVESNIQTYYQEMFTITESAKRLSLDKKIFKDTLQVFKVENIEEYNHRVGNKLLAGEDYYLLPYGESETTDVFKQTMNEVLDVRNIKNSYIISYIDTGKVEIFLIDGVRIGDNQVFTYSEIRDEYSRVTKK